MALDKDHVKFLRTDHRFKEETSCGVCGRVFSRSQGLLSHIVGKIKSQKNDWKKHKDFLESIVMGFTSRKNIYLSPLNPCFYETIVQLPDSSLHSALIAVY